MTQRGNLNTLNEIHAQSRTIAIIDRLLFEAWRLNCGKMSHYQGDGGNEAETDGGDCLTCSANLPDPVLGNHRRAGHRVRFEVIE